MVESVPRAAETISLEVVQAPKASSIYERLSMAALQGKSSVALLFGTAPKASLILSGAIFSGCLQVLFFPIICGIQTTGIGAAAEALPENWQLQENHAFVAAMYLAVQADINISLLVLLGNDSILNARSIDSVTGYPPKPQHPPCVSVLNTFAPSGTRYSTRAPWNKKTI